ncbi:MAG: succinate dehydrogenase iron-sulfur subunit [Thermoplasmata archaeon]|nr:succinate dehydrogenase iron-sulfur subunit [Thermoplasmata archaeon]
MEKIIFKVKRSEDGKVSQWQEYDVELPRKGMTVLDCLFWLVDNDEDPPGFRYTCRSAVCGSCAMKINGMNRLACKVQVAMLDAPIIIEPLPGFEVIKDLVIDMTPFFDKNESVHPYLLTLSEPPEKEYVQSVDQRKIIDEPTICVMCSACTSACPSFLSDPRFLGPASLLKDYRFFADSRADDKDPYLKAVGETHGAWNCFMCKHCAEVCPKQIKLVDHFVNLRSELMMEGLVEKSLPDIMQFYTRYGNSFGQSDKLRGKWTEGLPFKIKDARKEPVDYLWFVGDYGSYDSRIVEITRKIATALHKAGVDFGILFDGEHNAGNEVQRMGEEGLFETLAEHNIQALNSCKFNHILTTDPHTYNALKNDYPNLPDFNKDVKVLHYTELFSNLMDQGKLKLKKTNGIATYHDPCYLGRFNNVYEEPRKILESAVTELKEMERGKENSYCCGAGGGKIWMEDIPGTKERPSENRIKEALQIQAKLFVVACPKDYVMFQDAVKTLGCEDKISVRDIGELILDGLN